MSAASVSAAASSASGSGLSKRTSTFAALTFTRLPEPSSICRELSVSDITRHGVEAARRLRRAHSWGADCRLRRLHRRAWRAIAKCAISVRSPALVAAVRAAAPASCCARSRRSCARRARGRSPGRAHRPHRVRARRAGRAGASPSVAPVPSSPDRGRRWRASSAGAVYSATASSCETSAESAAPRAWPSSSVACGLTLTNTISTEAQVGA